MPRVPVGLSSNYVAPLGKTNFAMTRVKVPGNDFTASFHALSSFGLGRAGESDLARFFLELLIKRPLVQDLKLNQMDVLRMRVFGGVQEVSHLDRAGFWIFRDCLVPHLSIEHSDDGKPVYFAVDFGQR